MGVSEKTMAVFMMDDWNAFLTDMGAAIVGKEVTDFGDPGRELRAVKSEAILCDLSHLGLIKANGEDSSAFLQSQFSNDVTEVSEERSQLSAYCNPKGRMLASFRLYKYRDDYFMTVPAEILEATMQRLRMYILRSKVELTDASEERVRIGYCSANAPERLQACVDKVPHSVNDCVSTADFSIIRVHGIRPRFEIHGKSEAVKQLWRQLSEEALPVGSHHWALLDILSGIPTVLSQTREAFVPQMANMDLVGGLNFAKGCYPGQEIVARMHYLGKPKRRMYRIHMADAVSAQAGDEVIVREGKDIQVAGKIVDAREHPDGGIDALAVLQIDLVQQGSLSLGTGGPPITMGSLPYSIAT